MRLPRSHAYHLMLYKLLYSCTCKAVRSLNLNAHSSTSHMPIILIDVVIMHYSFEARGVIECDSRVFDRSAASLRWHSFGWDVQAACKASEIALCRAILACKGVYKTGVPSRHAAVILLERTEREGNPSPLPTFEIVFQLCSTAGWCCDARRVTSQAPARAVANDAVAGWQIGVTTMELWGMAYSPSSQ